MSFTAAACIGLPPQIPPAQRHGRIALGIAASVAVHLLILWTFRGPAFQASNTQQPTPRSIAVWLRPPPPPKPADPADTAAATPARAAPPRAHKPRRVIAVPRDQTPIAADRHIVRQPDDAADPGPVAAPRFDRDAALRMARQIAAEPDPGGAARRPLQAESKLARAISAAKRRDCKDGLPGGLLGPIIIMFDKKDSGCKW